jgi:palmitoyltransferase
MSQEIGNFIKTNLLEKKELLVAQIYRIEYRIEEIKHVKNMIERDAKQEYSETLEKLKYGEGEKVAVLEKEILDLQNDLDSLNDLGNYFLEISSNMADPLNFILNSRNVYEKLQYLISKPFKR